MSGELSMREASEREKHELERRPNMRKIVVKEWMTLDGVFDADTMGEWRNPYDSPEEQKSILEQYERGDVYLLGRTTYEMLWPFWSTQTDDEGPGRILNRMHKYVVSTTLSTAPWKESTIIRENVVEAITQLKHQPGKDIIIDGSARLVQSLMGTDLIDEYRFFVQPILMGKGRRFFTDGMPPTKLKLVESKTLSNGVLALTY
jgi:dihydrofolate reductase